MVSERSGGTTCSVGGGGLDVAATVVSERSEPADPNDHEWEGGLAEIFGSSSFVPLFYPWVSLVVVKQRERRFRHGQVTVR